MAEYYSAELAENVTRGMTENALEGKWAGGIVPLGYKLDEKHHLVIDEPKAAIVRQIYQLALEGHNQKYIIDELNKHHYTNSAGRPFSYNTLRVILKMRDIPVHSSGGIFGKKMLFPLSLTR